MTSSLQESHNLWKSLIVPIFYIGFELGFPMGQDSATFRDKGTTGQTQNLTKGQGQPVKIWDEPRDEIVQEFDSLSRPAGQNGTEQKSAISLSIALQ